jgi:hypothetical protein
MEKQKDQKKSRSTPLQAIRERCLWCNHGSKKEVWDCTDWCPLTPYRMGTTGGLKKPDPLKAIREKCIDCVENIGEVRKCVSVSSCPLWPFRLGKNPNISGKKRATVRKHGTERGPGEKANADVNISQFKPKRRVTTAARKEPPKAASVCKAKVAKK